MVSQAIAAGDVNAINYFVAQKYVEAFAELADGFFFVAVLRHAEHQMFGLQLAVHNLVADAQVDEAIVALIVFSERVNTVSSSPPSSSGSAWL